MKRKGMSFVLALVLALTLFPAGVSQAAAAAPVGSANGYLVQGDYLVISPAEKWTDSGKRTAVKTTPWELTAQNCGTACGNDIQTWKFGVSDKFYVVGIKYIDGQEYVRLRCKNFRESDGGLYWDIEGRSTKPGGNLHVWKQKDSASQWFCLEEDDDADTETFYIRNLNSGLYLVPENYFKNPGNDCSMKRTAWDEQGCNVVQSNYAFRWRIQVLNRDAVSNRAKRAKQVDKYANWMSLLPDDRYLSELNIPGTHDSGTANVTGSWNAGCNLVACQKYFIEQQLYAGVRSLDIRLASNNEENDVELVHGSTDGVVCHTPDHNGNSKNKRFSRVLDTLIAYLQKHRKETVLVTLKVDRKGHNVDKLLADDLRDYILGQARNWFYQWDAPTALDADHQTQDAAAEVVAEMRTNFPSPKLGDVRGKIVILSRVDYGTASQNDGLTPQERVDICSYLGPDISHWDDRYNGDLAYAQDITVDGEGVAESGVKVWVQDKYDTWSGTKWEKGINTIKQLNGQLTVDKIKQSGQKIVKITPTKAPQPDRKDFVYNYFSATQENPLWASRDVNDDIFNSDCFTVGSQEAKQRPRLGITVMDYVNKQLCRRVIDRNDFPSSAGMQANLAAPTLYGADGANVFALTGASQNSDHVYTVWPDSAVITYGYLLSEAELQFANDAVGGREGSFRFAEPEKLLTVADSGKGQTLIFTPAGDGEEETKDIPVTVNRRPLPIKIGRYEVEYGGEFRRNDLTVTAGGYLLPQDNERLPKIIESDNIHWVLKPLTEDGNGGAVEGEEIPVPSVPDTTKLGAGTITLRAEGTTDSPENRYPNYDATLETGVYLICKAVNISWTWDGSDWNATLTGVLPGDEDDVNVTVQREEGETDDGETFVQTSASLTGAKAEYYKIAEGKEIAPAAYNPSDFSSDDDDDDYDTNRDTTTDNAGTQDKPTSGIPEGKTLPTLQPGPKEFADVAEDYWAHEAVVWASEKGITVGNEKGLFAPEKLCTRAEIVTFLWRAAGCPEADNKAEFPDVTENAYYRDAVRWAASRGITTGYEDGSFRPDQCCTREEMVTFLYRVRDVIDTKVSESGGGNLTGFKDKDFISGYATDAFTWAVGTGVIQGAERELMPSRTCMRAEIVTVLYRLLAE